MKQLVIFVISVLILTACGLENESEEINADINDNDNVNEEEIENEIETLFEKETNINLVDNDDLNIQLLQVSHGRDIASDFVGLRVEIENKQNKTYEYYIKDLKVDGTEINSTRAWFIDGEIKPKETIVTFISGYDYDELTIEEHVSGTIVYSDYDGGRDEIKFGEYINE